VFFLIKSSSFFFSQSQGNSFWYNKNRENKSGIVILQKYTIPINSSTFIFTYYIVDKSILGLILIVSTGEHLRCYPDGLKSPPGSSSPVSPPGVCLSPSS
jgi:hypothetical protein